MALGQDSVGLDKAVRCVTWAPILDYANLSLMGDLQLQVTLDAIKLSVLDGLGWLPAINRTVPLDRVVAMHQLNGSLR